MVPFQRGVLHVSLCMAIDEVVMLIMKTSLPHYSQVNVNYPFMIHKVGPKQSEAMFVVEEG